MIKEDRMVQEFLELVQIDSPSGKERLLADTIKNKLARLGAHVSEDETGMKIGGNCGNIIARLPGLPKTPPLMFSAHLDRVSPGLGIKPHIEESILRSDGGTILGADDVAGIVQIFEAIRHLQEENLPHGDLEILLTVGEEESLLGARALDPAQLKSRIGYILDGGGNVGTIFNQAPAQENISITVTGRAAHAGICPEKGVNAIKVAASAIVHIKTGRIDEETTANLGIISGGEATNIVCEKVEVRCEARSRNPEKLAVQVRHMIKQFEKAAARYGAKIRIIARRCYPPVNLQPDDAPVALALKAVRRLGIEPILAATGGGSDANILNEKGIPCVVLGVGFMNAHSKEEYIEIEQLLRGARLVATIVEEAVEV